MASYSKPRIYTGLSAAAVARGKAVKSGADDSHFVVAAANTDRCYGILQNAVTLAEQEMEIAIQGGGGVALLGEAVAKDDDLVPHTDGTLVKPNAAGDAIIARAGKAGVAGDLIPVEIYYGSAHAAQ